MSVSMQFLRHSTIVQVDPTCTPKALSYYPKVATSRWGMKEFTLFEGMFVGFTGQTRTKLKKFRSVQHIFAYINKLKAGGWMSDDDYTVAWEYILFLAAKVDEVILSS